MDPLSIFDRAKGALAEIQISAVLKERLEFAIDKGAAAEAKVAELRSEIADFKAELKIAQLDIKKKDDELAVLREAMKEEIRFHEGIEFRRGSRTGGKWAAFCPKCHCPAVEREISAYIQCSDGKCEWFSSVEPRRLASVIAAL